MNNTIFTKGNVFIRYSNPHQICRGGRQQIISSNETGTNSVQTWQIVFLARGEKCWKRSACKCFRHKINKYKFSALSRKNWKRWVEFYLYFIDTFTLQAPKFSMIWLFCGSEENCKNMQEEAFISRFEPC